MPKSPYVIVIGGGLAGLTAALHLAEAGLNVQVLEADPRYAGGRVAGDDLVEIDGWQFRGEHGVHGIWSPYRNLQAMLTRHNIRPMFVPALEEAWIYKRGGKVKKAAVGTAIRYSPLPAPLHYINLFIRPKFLRMLGLGDWLTLPLVWGGLTWSLGVDPLAENQPLAGMTLHDLVRRWAPAVQAFMIGLSRNGLSARPDEIPLSGYIAFMRFYTVLRRDAWIFSYMPADGGTSLIDPLVNKLIELGGELRLGQAVTQLSRQDNAWRVSTTESLHYHAPQVILAADAPNTQKVVEASPDLQQAQPFYWPRGTETAVIRIWYDRAPRPGPEGGIFTGDFTIDNYFWLHIIQDQYRQWHKQTGGSAIEVHIYGPPETLQEADAALITRAVLDVQSAFPELKGHRIHQEIKRNPATHTLFGVGPQDQHLGIETPWPGIFCCGDWVRDTTPAFFLERACITGILAANQALAARKITPWPALPYPQPEPFAAFLENLMKRGRARRRARTNR